MDKETQIKTIYAYTDRHLHDGFSQLHSGQFCCLAFLLLLLITFSACKLDSSSSTSIELAEPISNAPIDDNNQLPSIQFLTKQLSTIAVRVLNSSATAKQAHVRGKGTGIVIDSSGLIVTTINAIAGDGKILIYFKDQTKSLGAEIVSLSECIGNNGLAVLRLRSGNSYDVLDWADSISAQNLPVLSAGFSGVLEQFTTNEGVVLSYTDDQILHSAAFDRLGFGGALVDRQAGELMGINLFSKNNDQFVALSTELTKKHLYGDGTLEFPGMINGNAGSSLGIMPEVILNNNDESLGIYVNFAVASQVGAKIGLQFGDLIVSLNDEHMGKTVSSATTSLQRYCSILSQLNPQNEINKISIKVMRDADKICKGEINGIPLSCELFDESSSRQDEPTDSLPNRYVTTIQGALTDGDILLDDGSTITDAYITTALEDGNAMVSVVPSGFNARIAVLREKLDGGSERIAAAKQDDNEDKVTVNFLVRKNRKYALIVIGTPSQFGLYSINFSPNLSKIKSIQLPESDMSNQEASKPPQQASYQPL